MSQIDSLKKYSDLGDIIVIDSDALDNELFQQIASELGVSEHVRLFSDGDSAMDYLQETENKIGVIFCEIYLPKRNGMELKLKMREDPVLRKKSIPFLLFSTVINASDIETAYLEVPVQGLFLKKNNYAEMKEMVNVALQYWSTCIHPQ